MYKHSKTSKLNKTTSGQKKYCWCKTTQGIFVNRDFPFSLHPDVVKVSHVKQQPMLLIYNLKKFINQKSNAAAAKSEHLNETN